MMKIFRFVGSESAIGTTAMSRFGQRFSIDEKIAIDSQKGGAAILEESDFNACGFTPEELKIWADPFMSIFDIPGDPADIKAKAEFLRKREVAQQKYRDIRQGLLSPQDKHNTQARAEVAPTVVEISDAPAPSSQPETASRPNPVAVKKELD